MDKTKMTYFKEEDILHFIISEENESKSIEISPNITAELNENGDLIGIEILEASSFIRDTILESAQAKIMNLQKSYNKANSADAKSHSAD
ncbi:MAG: DUF2283 domain-containing protein [Thermodesulfobacteriota bacterium]|nr:DUF2283 domain-containing protein [Thermodesulfobacteriota bacterium]